VLPDIKEPLQLMLEGLHSPRREIYAGTTQ
jgi:hypothetical protein